MGLGGKRLTRRGPWGEFEPGESGDKRNKLLDGTTWWRVGEGRCDCQGPARVQRQIGDVEIEMEIARTGSTEPNSSKV